MAGRGTAATQAPRFSIGYMDWTADPRKDFYRYAVGGWQDTHPLPPDRARYGAFNELLDWNFLQMRKIAERCAREAPNAEDPVIRMVGDFYRSALDTKSIEAAGFGPIEDLWLAVDRVNSLRDVAGSMAHLHNEGVWSGFSSFSKADDKDSAHYTFYFEQGGLALPDREYYLSERFAGLRKQYFDHLVRMFALKGVPRSRAKMWAKGVMKIETSLARASRTRTLLREREKNYNRRKIEELKDQYPSLSLPRYLGIVGVRPPSYVVVGQPEFFGRLDSLAERGSLDDWRAYLHWCVLHSAAPCLSSRVEKENFDFFERKLKGQKEQQPRWKRALRVIDSSIGEALGRLYVEANFTDESRRRAKGLVDDLREVFTRRLEALAWMSEETRRLALAKFAKFRVKIGHPEAFRDYSSIRIDPRDYAGNVRRSDSFEFHRLTRRVGGRLDRNEWLMTTPSVNAFFEETMNEIVFPAGILQPPFFDLTADDAVNYGGIGAVIGHEITHGYDDQGRKYDGHGNLKDWWTKEDRRRFNLRASAVVKAYSAQEALPGVHVNGRLTLGENIADLGGVRIAFEALQERLTKDPSARRQVDGLTPEQRFFISYAQIWRINISEMEARRLATTDPHSPGHVRGVLPAKNHPAFDSAFPPPRGEAPAKRRIGVW